ANDDKFYEALTQASKEVEILVASFHFGDEYQTKSNARQQTLARRAIDAGAKLVIGHHPHVRQEVERYKGGLIAYSLGNFVFDQDFSQETKQGTALEVSLSKTGKILDYQEQLVTIDKDFHPNISS
ncbi:MAG: CapA family protein, partial [Patescibacteria group bacterium]